MSTSVFVNHPKSMSGSDLDLVTIHLKRGDWECLVEFLDVALLPLRPDLHEEIVESCKYCDYISFSNLSADDYNHTVTMIMDFITKDSCSNVMVKNGISVWRNFVEPKIIRDERYQGAK